MGIGKRRPREGVRSGMTLLEVTIAMSIVAVVMLAAAAGFARNLSAVEQARTTTDAAIFLDSVVENVEAQPYDDLLSLNGNRIFSGTGAADSRYAVDLAVFLADVDLLQIGAVLVELPSERQLGRVTWQRTRR